MNSKFPLLKLPLLGIEGVVKSLEVADLIQLSFSSKRINRLMKSLRLKMNRFNFVVRCQCTAILFNYVSLNARSVWILNYIKHKKSRPVTASIGGMEISSYIRNDYLYTNTVGNVQGNERVQMDYLKELIHFPAPDIKILSDDLQDWKRPILLGINECRKLVVFGEKKLKEEHMQEILQSCSIREMLFLRVQTPTTYTHDILKWKLPKAIYLNKSAHWITSDVFLQSECSHMMLIDCDLTSRDFRQFFERWLNSDDTNFVFLYLHWKNGVPRDLNLENLGVELREFDPKTRNRSFPYVKNYAIDMSTGQDFLRKDGTLASILILGNVVSFCVFHERFPNLGGRWLVPPDRLRRVAHQVIEK